MNLYVHLIYCVLSCYAYSLLRLSYLHRIRYWGDGGVNAPFFLQSLTTTFDVTVSVKPPTMAAVHHGKTAEDDI